MMYEWTEKTTPLNILGGMDTASAGQIIVDGNDITQYNKKQLVGYRRNDIGFVFQFYNLVPNLTALENVELATIKVLGFYDAEVHLYVNKETLILTGIGILLGLPLGSVLGSTLIR